MNAYLQRRGLPLLYRYLSWSWSTIKPWKMIVGYTSAAVTVELNPADLLRSGRAHLHPNIAHSGHNRL
jgi:hypothetical protein